MELQELRNKIDEIDNKLIDLFQQRMDLSAKVAKYKKQHNLPVYDPKREQEILDSLSRKVKNERKTSMIELFTLLFKLSRNEQEKILEK